MRKKLSRSERFRFAAELLRLIRKEGGDATLDEDGTLRVYTPKPLPPMIAFALTECRRSLSKILAKQTATPLPYSLQKTCPDCGKPFVLMGFAADESGRGDSHVWQCGCHTLLGEEL